PPICREGSQWLPSSMSVADPFNRAVLRRLTGSHRPLQPYLDQQRLPQRPGQQGLLIDTGLTGQLDAIAGQPIGHHPIEGIYDALFTEIEWPPRLGPD